MPFPDSSRGPGINIADISNADGSSHAGGFPDASGISNAAGNYNPGGMSNTTGTSTNTGHSNVAGISNAGGAVNAAPAAFANNPQPAFRPAMNLSRRFPTAPGVSASLTPATAELQRTNKRTPQAHTEMCAVEAENAKDTHGGMLPAAFELYKGPENLSGIGFSSAEIITHDLSDGLPEMDGQKLPLADFLQLISWERLNNILECCDATDPRKIKLSLLRADACIAREDVLGAELVYLDLWHGIASANNSSETTDHVEGLINVGMQYAEFLMTYNRREEARNVLLVLWSSIETRQSDWISSELLVRIADMAKELGLSHISMGALKSSLDLLRAQDPDSYTVHSLETLVDAGINESLRALPPGTALPTNVETAARQMFDARVLAKAPTVDKSLIELCRSLTDGYASQREWNEVKTVANALLRIAWPAVTDESSTVTDGAAPIAGLQDIAMSAAEGHEKTQEPGTAGTIYQRIVQLAQDPAVSDPDLTSKAAQEALRIYERLGQVDKTNETLQSLVNFYLLTRGEENPLTIETSYKLARTCLQDGQVDNAVHRFQRIAICLEQPEYQDQRAIPALKALLVIHRGRKDWDQAREVYDSLWQTFLHKGRDYGIRRETGKKLFTEYSQLLESQLGAQPRTLHQLAEEYRQRCDSVFGDQDVASINAAMMLAESWEGMEVNSENALRIYEDVNDEFGDIDSTSRIDLIPFVEAAKSELLKYYTRRLRDPMSQDRLSRATQILRNEYHRCFAQAGYTSAQTIGSLGSWVFLLIKARTQEANHEATEQLQEAVTSIWESEPEPTVLYEAALALGSWYLDCGLVSEATALINDLREKLIFSLPPNDKTPIQEAARPSLASSLFFLTAFETRLTGTMMSFANTHSQALLESGFWRSFQELKGQTSLAGPALVSGAKLWALLNGRNTTSNAWLERQLYDVFMKNFGASFPLGTRTPMGFFLVLLQMLSSQRPDADLPHLSCAAIASHIKSLLAHDDLQGVLDVFGPDFDFSTYVDAYSSESMIEQGFQLASALAGLNPKNASNSALSAQVMGVGKRIMHALLQMCRERQLTLDNIAIDHLLELASVLGQQENFEDLEVSLERQETSFPANGCKVAPAQDLDVSSATWPSKSGSHRQDGSRPGRRALLSSPCRLSYRSCPRHPPERSPRVWTVPSYLD